MKIQINEEEKRRILNLYIPSDEMINEQAWLRKFIGSSADDLIRSFGDDAVKTVEILLSKALSKPVNYIAKNGKTFLKSATGSEVSIDNIELALKLVSNGQKTADEIAGIFPRKLADGTEFRDVMVRNLKKSSKSSAKVGGVSKLPITNVGKDFMELASQNSGWLQILNVKGNMSGWKFHVYAENLDEVAFLYERLLPVANKYGAGMKVAGKGMLDRLAQNTLQKGKGVTLYVPASVIEKNAQKEFLSNIQSATKGYNKTGQISGDKMITDNIGYRYELSKPINTSKGVDIESYRNLYSSNEGGGHNISNNPDLFK